MQTAEKATELQRLARASGVQTSYVNNVGRTQVTSEETLRLILDRIGANPAETGVRVMEPVAVKWQRAKSGLTIRVPANEIARAVLRLKLDDGDEECIPLRELARGRESKQNGAKIAELRLDVPELPMGYHTLSVESESASGECLLICAPKKLYAETGRQSGGFMPLYAAHSEESWGAGNLTDWRRLCEWMGGLSADVMGTLPVMAAFLDRPVCEPSPYSPSSRLFWNEFFIDITAVPEFRNSSAAQRLAGSPAFRRKLDAFRASEFIDYKEEWSVRRKVLEVLAQEFFAKSTERYRAFRAYVKSRPEVEEYAQFRAACDQKKKSWHVWNEEAKNGKLTKSDYAEEVKSFYLYVQWIAQEQMDEVLGACRDAGVKFYLDLPLGVNADGFDAWRYRDFFAPRVNAGAPPDSFFTKGQDWGFAPLHPQRTRELKYRYVIDYLRFQMRHTGLLRIDHVMGLHRLWWVPHGFPASEGAYVNYPAEELYAILSVESHRHKTMLVGENLGTVPPEVNKSMDRHGLRRMYVLQYEQQPKGPLRAPEKQVVASVNTHDMPSFAAHWNGLDIDDRVDLGLIAKNDIAKERKNRDLARKGLVLFLRKQKLLKAARPTTEEVLDAVLKYLGKSRAETVLVTLEDVWGEERSQNVPGTSTERPNWRRKSKRTLEELFADEELTRRLRQVLRR
ncbi:MAG TPA: 4-alpha-glucanotransferase [Verrucomicrobiae bacterium]